MVIPVPGIEVCNDPDDDYLLGMAQAGSAEYLVSGDRHHVLTLENWYSTHIVTAREMVGLLKLS